MKTATRPPAPKRSDNFVEIPPNASRTLMALRELGYDSVSAIGDLIDNSIDAGAKKISVTVGQVGDSFVLDVLDDGAGMSAQTLQEAIRLGSDTEKDLTTDLGKYGMGLTTASLSIAKTIFVLTRQKGQQGYEATFDVSTVEKENKWVLELRPASSKYVIEEIGDYGTLVRLSNVDRIDDTNPARFVTKLREYIGRVFRYHIGSGIKITVNRRIVEPIDPLMRDHTLTQQRFDADIDLGGGHKARLTIVELPDLGTVDEEQLGIVPRKSGFYVVRNKREIVAATTFEFYKHHHSYSHFRAELSFTGDLDALFHVDVKKTSILPNDKVIEKIHHVSRRFIEQSGREGRDRAIENTKIREGLFLAPARPATAPKPAGNEVKIVTTDHGKAAGDLFTVDRSNGTVVLNYNQRHPLVQMVSDTKIGQVQRLFNTICLALASVPETKEGRAFIEQVNQTLLNLMDAGSTADTWARRDAQQKK